MADATSSRKHPHLITIRGNKEIEDALVALANSLGLTKYGMLVRLLECYVENVTPEKIIQEKSREIEMGHESAIRLIKEGTEKDEAEIKRGRPSAKDKEAVGTT